MSVELNKIPRTLKFMFVSMVLSISAMMMMFLSGLTDPYQAKWIFYTMYILFIFSSIFTILAIISFPDDRFVEQKKGSE